MVTMIFMYKTFQSRDEVNKESNNRAAKIIGYFYCLNPVLIYLTARGSCEGITMALAASFWYYYLGGGTHGNMSAS